MELSLLRERLRRNAAAFRALLGGLPIHETADGSADWIRWTPAPGKWSLLLVVNHLADEERDDFKPRIRNTLAESTEPWPGIDPEGWVESRHYERQEFQASLDRFLQERADSLAWLDSLERPDWTLTNKHPVLGPLSAGDLLGAWVDHDHHHMRQILGLLHGLLCEEVAPYHTRYAGAWAPPG